MSSIVNKIIKRVRKAYHSLLLSPIEVWVFHAVTPTFNPAFCLPEDWNSTLDFEKTVKKLKKKYTIISLEEAYQKLRKDLFRFKRYAVLTCDDGFKSTLAILPFLASEGVPITLFINPKYLDGVSFRGNYTAHPEYINESDLKGIDSPLVTIGMHGFEHIDCSEQSAAEFRDSATACIKTLETHPRFVPFFAYPWGKYSAATQQVLMELNITPVLCDGASNYRYHNGISRKCIEASRTDLAPGGLV